MSATATGAELPEGAHAYFRAIETIFIELRGAPLMLAPTDYHVAKGWLEAGIPLALVERVLRDYFYRRREQGKTDSIRGLRRLRKPVEAAWRRQRELEAAGVKIEVEPLDVASRLAALAQALPVDLGARAGWAGRLQALTGEPAAVETRLAELDRELLAELETSLDAGAREELDRRLETALATLAHHLPADELGRTRARLREEMVRERAGLPVLSLFTRIEPAEGA